MLHQAAEGGAARQLAAFLAKPSRDAGPRDKSPGRAGNGLGIGLQSRVHMRDKRM
jgi:hypothetical protein